MKKLFTFIEPSEFNSTPISSNPIFEVLAFLPVATINFSAKKVLSTPSILDKIEIFPSISLTDLKLLFVIICCCNGLSDFHNVYHMFHQCRR